VPSSHCDFLSRNTSNMRSQQIRDDSSSMRSLHAPLIVDYDQHLSCISHGISLPLAFLVASPPHRRRPPLLPAMPLGFSEKVETNTATTGERGRLDAAIVARSAHCRAPRRTAAALGVRRWCAAP
jgi:hypothetical protein